MNDLVDRKDQKGLTVEAGDDLTEDQWRTLLRRIKKEKCTPFLGPESGFDSIPPASKIAEDWAFQYGYPLEDRGNLPRVAQFRVSTDADFLTVREDLAELLEGQPAPHFNDPDEPHRFLASLPIKVYINTHYRNFIFQALKANPTKDPRWEWCRCLEKDPPEADSLPTLTGYTPTVANPLVYYLFGHSDEPSSMVLTEDDYLDFLVRTSTPDLKLIPRVIENTLTNGSLLFLGYQFSDLDFRVILRKLKAHQREENQMSWSVQVVAAGESPPTEQQLQGAKAFLSKYCSKFSISFVCGSTRQFVSRLKQRWEEYDASPVGAP